MNPIKSKNSKKSAVSAEPKRTFNGMKLLTLKPRVSEKAYALSEQGNVYIFDVPGGANKFDVAKAVASQYEVGVISVRLAGVPGKAVRSYRNRGRRSINSKRTDVHKAYVTLKEGDKLPIFDAVEEAEAPKEKK
jgi:ribosomal protein L23